MAERIRNQGLRHCDPFEPPGLATVASPHRSLTRRAWVAGFVLCFALAVVTDCHAQQLAAPNSLGPTFHRVKSKYSNILLRKNGSVLTLVFVRDSGEEALESQIDLNEPDELRFEYLRSMFLSYGFVTNPRRVLIVGLGGGAMVHFFQKNDPEVHVDVVEIDDAVVNIAEKFFRVKRGIDGASPQIFVDDGLAFISRVREPKYDVIYLDAFLKPSGKTDSTGVPLEQRTRQFYESIQNALTPDGVAVFNVNPHERIHEDVAGFRAAFPQIYAFTLPRNSGKVVVASKVATRLPRSVIVKNLEAADAKLQPSFSLKSRRDWLDK